jgi:hypothetical protein
MTDIATATAPAEGQGGAPVESTEPVQSPEAQPQAQSQELSGQDLIAPYLEGVDESIRSTVAETLERYRQDADANFNKRFERTSTQLKAWQQLAEDPSHLEVPLGLYENLMSAPVDTLEWVADRFQQELGVDLRAQLLEKWGASKDPASAPAEQPADPADQPLTRAQLEQWHAEQEQARHEQQAQEQARQTTETWLKEVTSAAGLELGEGDIVLKEAILRHAAQVMPQVRDGKQAIQMAVEAITNRFAPKAPKQQEPAPKLATGGTAPGQPAPDYTDQKVRREAMLSMLTAAQQQ